MLDAGWKLLHPLLVACCAYVVLSAIVVCVVACWCCCHMMLVAAAIPLVMVVAGCCFLACLVVIVVIGVCYAHKCSRTHKRGSICALRARCGIGARYARGRAWSRATREAALGARYAQKGSGDTHQLILVFFSVWTVPQSTRLYGFMCDRLCI